MNTWRFWRETFERAVKTAAQSAILAIGASDTGALDLFTLEPMVVLGFAVGGGILSILTSIASLPVGAAYSPSAIE